VRSHEICREGRGGGGNPTREKRLQLLRKRLRKIKSQNKKNGEVQGRVRGTRGGMGTQKGGARRLLVLLLKLYVLEIRVAKRGSHQQHIRGGDEKRKKLLKGWRAHIPEESAHKS